MTHWFLEKIASWGERPAFVFGDRTISHTMFAGLVHKWSDRLDQENICGGDVVVVHGDYSPESCALVFALAARRAMVTPLTPLPRGTLEQRCATAGANCVIDVAPDGSPSFETLSPATAPVLPPESDVPRRVSLPDPGRRTADAQGTSATRLRFLSRARSHGRCRAQLER